MTKEKKFKYLEAKELLKRIQNKEAFILIDILTGIHFEKVHIPGSRSACVFEVSFLEQVQAIARDKTTEIVLYGSSGRSMDALSAAVKLQREGYKNIKILNGGLEAWRSQGFELHGEDPRMADPETVLRLDDGIYPVDAGQSLIEWFGRNPNTKHFGTVRLKRGQVEIRNSKLTGEFEIDMDSIDNINLKGDELHPVLVSHLKSDDFFFVKMFPTAVLTIIEGQVVETPYLSYPNYDCKSMLTLRGTKADLAFQATVNKLEDGGLSAEAHFDIDRTRWEVIYGSSRFFENIGMHLVFDLISFQVKIIADSQ